MWTGCDTSVARWVPGPWRRRASGALTLAAFARSRSTRRRSARCRRDPGVDQLKQTRLLPRRRSDRSTVAAQPHGRWAGAKHGETRPLAAAANGSQQKGSVLANLAHHLCRVLASGNEAVCRERSSSSVKGELQVRGGEMQRCRNHWQHAQVGFDETTLARVRHHALDGRAKSFGMLVHFSRNRIGRNSSRVTLLVKLRADFLGRSKGGSFSEFTGTSRRK